MEPSVLCHYDELANPATLKHHPRNPNVHPEDQIEALGAYIAFTGWRHPVIVSRRSGYVVAGHGRVIVAVVNGWTVPVVYQDFADDNEELVFVLADNRLPELAHMDTDILEADLKILDDSSFDVGIIGFDIGEFVEQEIDHAYGNRWGQWETAKAGKSKRMQFHFGELQATYPEEVYLKFVAAVQKFQTLDAWVDSVIGGGVQLRQDPREARALPAKGKRKKK